MKVFKYILILSFLMSCKAQYHIEKADKHTKKAIQKGAIIEKNETVKTITEVKHDTIRKKDSIFVTRTIYKTIYKDSEPIIKYVTRKDKKAERKQQKHENKIEKAQVKINKINAKTAKKEVKNKGFFNRLLQFITLIIIIFIILAVFRFFHR